MTALRDTAAYRVRLTESWTGRERQMTQDAVGQERTDRQWRMAAWIVGVLPVFGLALLAGSVVELVRSDNAHERLQTTGRAVAGTVYGELPRDKRGRDWRRIDIGYQLDGEWRSVKTLCPLSGCPAPHTATTLWFDPVDSDHWVSDFGQGDDAERVRRSQVLIPAMGLFLVAIGIPLFVWRSRDRRAREQKAQLSVQRVERVRAERLRRRSRR